MPDVRTILFVCTGNTCRSPMAQALCAHMLAKKLGCAVADLPERGFVVISAGVAAMMGMPASPEAVQVVAEMGADLAGHQSQPLTRDLVERADHLLVMTESHRWAVEYLLGESAIRPRLLACEGCDISDPIGCELEAYRECAQQIAVGLEKLLAELDRQ